MKRPRNLTALVFGALHLAFCLIFFAAYFASPDSERGIAILLFWFIDPWILPFARGFSGTLSDEIILAASVTAVGTGLWWCVGWLIGRVSHLLFVSKKEPIQQPQKQRP